MTQIWVLPFTFQAQKKLPDNIIFNALTHRDRVSKEAAKSSYGCTFPFQHFLRKLEITLPYLSGHFNLFCFALKQPKRKAELLGTSNYFF